MQMRIKSLRNVSADDSHCAFTDLIKWRGRYYCAFRRGQTHASYGGSVVVMVSDDLAEWTELASLRGEFPDVRDPHFLGTEEALFVYCPSWNHPAADDLRFDYDHRLSVMSECRDGRIWSDPVQVYDPGWALWKPVAVDGVYYVAAHAPGPGKRTSYEDPDWTSGARVTLLMSGDGREWVPISDIAQGDAANETALYADAQNRLVALVRREFIANGVKRPNLLCMAEPPYEVWREIELDRAIQGPALCEFGEHLLIGGRTHPEPYSDLIPTASQMTLLTLGGGDKPVQSIAHLPSWGDTSYPGMVPLSDAELAVSYYSSHEGNTQVYVAVVELEFDE